MNNYLILHSQNSWVDARKISAANFEGAAEIYADAYDWSWVDHDNIEILIKCVETDVMKRFNIEREIEPNYIVEEMVE